MGGLLGINPTLAAAIGFVTLFAYATNSILSAVFLGLELFGLAILPYAIVACLVTALLAGKRGLFHGRLIHSPLFDIKEKLSKGC